MGLFVVIIALRLWFDVLRTEVEPIFGRVVTGRPTVLGALPLRVDCFIEVIPPAGDGVEVHRFGLGVIPATLGPRALTVLPTPVLKPTRPTMPVAPLLTTFPELTPLPTSSTGPTVVSNSLTEVSSSSNGPSVTKGTSVSLSDTGLSVGSSVSLPSTGSLTAPICDGGAAVTPLFIELLP